jgi:rod shape-determining protein MreD
VSKRAILAIINFSLMFLCGAALIMFQSTFLNMIFSDTFKPNLLLIMCVYFGFNRTYFEGSILAFILGHVFDLTSSAPMGFYCLLFLIVMSLTKLVSNVLYIQGNLVLVAFVLSFTIVERASALMILWGFGNANSLAGLILIHAVPIAIFNSICSIPLFAVLKWIDEACEKDLPRKGQTKDLGYYFALRH